MKNYWRLIGQITLYTLIVFGVICLVAAAIAGYWYWFIVIAGCFAFVIGGEIVSFVRKGYSISSQYGKWLKKDKLWSLLFLGGFSLAMISLVIHLLAYGFRP